MRQAYQLQLEELAEHGGRMCELAQVAMRDGSRALLDRDLALAEKVIAIDVELDSLRATAEESAIQLLALQAPVATDLRTVVSALWIVADLQRMGTLAIHVAKAARRRHPNSAVPIEVRPIFERMSSVAGHLATRTHEVLRTRDLELAKSMDSEDDLMDDLHRQLLEALMAPGFTGGVQAAVDLTLLGRFYERFADHAVAVARRTVYLVTGENVGGDTTVLLTTAE